VRGSDMHDNVGYTPYEGMQLRGRAATVISRGGVIVSEGGDDGIGAGRGSFVARTP